MPLCPKCGNRQSMDWPVILMTISFGLLYVVFILTADNDPRQYRLAGLLAFLLFLVAATWKGVRAKHSRRENLKQDAGD
jgi:hypothetical protein